MEEVVPGVVLYLERSSVGERSKRRFDLRRKKQKRGKGRRGQKHAAAKITMKEIKPTGHAHAQGTRRARRAGHDAQGTHTAPAGPYTKACERWQQGALCGSHHPDAIRRGPFEATRRAIPAGLQTVQPRQCPSAGPSAGHPQGAHPQPQQACVRLRGSVKTM